MSRDTASKTKWFWAAYLPLSVLYMELIFRIASGAGFDMTAILLTAGFSLALGLGLTALCALGAPGFFRAAAAVLLGALTLYFCVHTVYKDIFGEYLGVGLLAVGGDALSGYWRETLRGIARCIPWLLLIFLPLVLWLAFSRRLLPESFNKKARLLCAAAFLVFQAGASVSVRLADSGPVSPAFLYGEGFVMDSAVRSFGMLTAQRLDVADNLAMDRRAAQRAAETPGPAATARPTPAPTATPAATAEPVRATQVLDIDFDALIEGEWNGEIRAIHEFFRDSEPSYTNEYTGMFEGKNLIWIVAESFSAWALDETHTPTLYKLANEGFVFDNFYCPVTAASTTGGEFITLTGLMQNISNQLLKASAGDYLPYAMGNLMNERGYTSLAYHGGRYTYYGRDEALPNLGYFFAANGHGLTLDEPGLLPTSDLDMFRNSIPDYIGKPPFNIYYMTISGHMDYTFRGGHDICARYEEDVADLTDYTERARAYVASQMDFDLAMEYLLSALEEAGLLEDTVIVVSADHYPYGLEAEDMESMSGRELDPLFDYEHSSLILWSGSMEKPVEVTKYCSSSDVLPTLLNLFGVPYDSRLMMGRDILSDSENFVAFRSYSFLSEYGQYRAATGEFIPAPGAGEPPEGYTEAMVERIRKMYQYSADIIYTNYYSRVFPQG